MRKVAVLSVLLTIAFIAGTLSCREVNEATPTPAPIDISWESDCVLTTCRVCFVMTTIQLFPY